MEDVKRLQVALECARNKDYKDAIRIVENIISGKTEPNGNYYYYLFFWYHMVGNIDSVVKSYNLAIVHKSTMESAHRQINKIRLVNFGDKLLRINVYKAATKYYDLAIIHEPDNVIYLKLAFCDCKVGNEFRDKFVDMVLNKLEFKELLDILYEFGHAMLIDKCLEDEPFYEMIGDIYYNNGLKNVNFYKHALYLYLLCKNPNGNIYYKMMICCYSTNNSKYIDYYTKSVGSKLEAENRDNNKHIIKNIEKYSKIIYEQLKNIEKLKSIEKYNYNDIYAIL
jgi:tetratricopeptide (TPR) repeat protein